MVVVQMPACCRDQLTPSSDHVSWFEPLAGITSDDQGGAGEPRNRLRALAVCWGHEPLVGCRAKGALPLGSVRVPDQAWTWDQT
jgi:hypothetical protein